LAEFRDLLFNSVERLLETLPLHYARCCAPIDIPQHEDDLIERQAEVLERSCEAETVYSAGSVISVP
jgi:hypothetical protein